MSYFANIFNTICYKGIVTKIHENCGISKHVKIKNQGHITLTAYHAVASSTNVTFVSCFLSTNEIN